MISLLKTQPMHNFASINYAVLIFYRASRGKVSNQFVYGSCTFY